MFSLEDDSLFSLLNFISNITGFMVCSCAMCKARQRLLKSSFSVFGDQHQSSGKSYQKTGHYSAKIPIKMVINVNQFQFCLEYSFMFQGTFFSENLVKGVTLSLIIFFPDFKLQRIQVFWFDVQFLLAVLQKHVIFHGGVCLVLGGRTAHSD